MSIFYQQSAVRLRAPLVVDRYGNAVRDWDNASEEILAGVNVQPYADTPGEEVGDRSNWDGTLKLISARGTALPLAATDRIRFGGLVYEINAEIEPYYSAGQLHHQEARAIRHVG